MNVTTLRRRALLGAASLAAPSAGHSGLPRGAFAQGAYPEPPDHHHRPLRRRRPDRHGGRAWSREAMGHDLGQTVVVENAGGAGGTLGAQRVAQARPDGYTLLLHHIGMATTPTLYRRLAYDPVSGFEPIGLVTEVPMTLVGEARTSPPIPWPRLVAVIRRDQRQDQLCQCRHRRREPPLRPAADEGDRRADDHGALSAAPARR